MFIWVAIVVDYSAVRVILLGHSPTRDDVYFTFEKFFDLFERPTSTTQHPPLFDFSLEPTPGFSRSDFTLQKIVRF